MVPYCSHYCFIFLTLITTTLHIAYNEVHRLTMGRGFLILSLLVFLPDVHCWGFLQCAARETHWRIFSRQSEYEDYESYSRCLTPKQAMNSVLRERNEYAIVDGESFSQRIARVIRGVFRRQKTKKPGKLVLLLNGESTWNANHTFTGWEDPPLTDKGKLICQHAARILIAEGIQPDIVYTSKLKRAIQSVQAILDEMDAWFIPVVKTYRLNARMYGAVQGLSKQQTAERLGANVVQAWRNTLKARPPPLLRSDPASPAHDRRYGSLSKDEIPEHESIFDCHERARALWSHRIQVSSHTDISSILILLSDSRGFLFVYSKTLLLDILS